MFLKHRLRNEWGPGTRLWTAPPGGEHHHARGFHRRGQHADRPAWKCHRGNSTPLLNIPARGRMLRTHRWGAAATPKQDKQAACARLLFWGCPRKHCCC